MTRSTLIAGLALTALATAALAPQARAQGDMMAMARTAAANQLGVMQYCQKQGYVDATAVSAQQNAISRLPAGPAGESTTAAQALGQSGTLASGTTRMSLSDIAGKNNTTVLALCKQMGSSATQAAAAGSTGTMPNGMAMPNGMTMPTMPNGMSMPTMPSMPGMPTNMPSMPAMPK